MQYDMLMFRRYVQMETIKYRTIETGDYPAIGEMINQAFGLYRYVSDEKTLECFKLQYVYSCLSEAAYHCVAEQNGRIVGVIMGNAKSDYKILRHLNYILRTLQYGMKMIYYGRKFKTGIDDYKKLHEIYHTFSGKHKGEFDGVLTLFAVKENCRGLGVGTELLSRFSEYLKSKGTKRIYLYTDTTCNYGFYEHKGFERLEEQTLEMTKDGKPFQMDVFLYGYSVK